MNRKPTTQIAHCLSGLGVATWLTFAAINPIHAQQTNSIGMGIELGTTGGLLRQTDDPRTIEQTGSLLHLTRVALPVRWQWNHLVTQATFTLARSAQAERHATYALGAFQIASHRGKLSASLGVEHRIGVASNVTEQFGGFGDSISSLQIDSMKQSKTELWRALDVVGSLGWNLGPSFLRVIAGVPTHNRSTPWLGLEGTVGLSHNSALVVETRYQSTNASVRMPTVSLGLRTSLWRTGTGVRIKNSTGASHRTNDAPIVRTEVVGDSVRLSIYLPNVKQAVVAGDVTNWNSATMTSGDDGWWHIALHTSSKSEVSRIHLRTDNADWGPIPGLPSTRDEYGGMVSLLVITDSNSSKDSTQAHRTM